MEKNTSGIWFGNMEFDKEQYKTEFEKLLKTKPDKKFFIKKSSSSFKINKFAKKSIDSLELAKINEILE